MTNVVESERRGKRGVTDNKSVQNYHFVAIVLLLILNVLIAVQYFEPFPEHWLYFSLDLLQIGGQALSAPKFLPKKTKT